jgi:hypothetical protein
MRVWQRSLMVILPALSALILNCQSALDPQDPATDLIEYESVFQFLKAYTIWQDNIPDAPFDFPSPAAILAAVHDTLKNNDYTKYYIDPIGASASLGTNGSTVSLDTLTDSTALLKITTFGLGTFDDFLMCVPEAANFRNIVVDLRGNRGGYLDVLDSIIESFIPYGTAYISARYREFDEHQRRFVTRDWEPWTTERGPIGVFEHMRFAVLMDEWSASASEILVSALYEGVGAALIGNRTYGKGIGQIHIPRRTRQTMQVTFLMLKGINNRIGAYHRRGIEPDTIPESVRQEGDTLDPADQPVFYAVKRLEPKIGPGDIRYPALGKTAAPESSPVQPMCAKIVDEEQLRSLLAR